MQSDFKPVHLQDANAKLEKHLLSTHQQNKESHPKKAFEESWWKKCLGLFKK